MRHSDVELLLQGHGLLTAEMFYRLPDYPSVLNSLVWQGMDLAPDFPRLFDFIAFWNREIEGKLHSVRFCYAPNKASGLWRQITRELTFDLPDPAQAR